MATSTTASSTNINTARSAGEGNELLDLRDTDASEQDSSSDDNGGSPDDPAPSGHDLAAQGKDGLSEALKAERRRTNHLEKELRGVRQQLTRFSEINPEEYSRLQEAERQKQLLEQQVELRERQMEEASAKKVATVAAERDGAQALVLALRKERLLERAFSEAEGRTGGDGRGTFFDVFKSLRKNHRRKHVFPRQKLISCLFQLSAQLIRLDDAFWAVFEAFGRVTGHTSGQSAAHAASIAAGRSRLPRRIRL